MTVGILRGLASSAAVAGVIATGLLGPVEARAASAPAVAALTGSWSGSGRIAYTDGSSESLNCTAYYTGTDSELRMAIQCRSDKNPIHIRSRLKIDGKRATGEWEERTFNASGTATGTADSDRISLNVSGGGFSGTMTVAFSRSSHSVTINAEGIALRRVTIQFSRR